MIRQLFIFCILVLLPLSVLQAQIIPFKNYTVRDDMGLPSNYVSDIVQDHKGYIWMATDIGLAKFDGYSFETFTIEHGLSDNIINCLTVDKNGKIWAGTETGGICVIDDFGVEVIDEEDGLFPGQIADIFTDNNGNIWATGEEDGISIIKKDSILTYSTENSELTAAVFCHFVDEAGIVWIGTYDGIFYFDNSLMRLNHELLNERIVWDIIKDQYDRLWIATQEKGVFCYDGDTVLVYNLENGMSSEITLALLEDKKGRILVGTYDGGINIIENSRIKQDLVNKTADYWIWELFEDSRGRIWARTHDQGVLAIKENSVKEIDSDNHLISDHVLAIFEDNYNNLWFPTSDGLSLYTKSFFEIYADGYVSDVNNIMSVYIDEKDAVYAGTELGLTVFKPDGTINHYSNENGLPEEEPSVLQISEDSIGNIWLATNGINQINNKNKLNYYEIEELNQQEYRIVTTDLVVNDNILYAASEIGLISFDVNSESYSILTTKDGLIANNIYSLEIDNSGNLWCGTTNGLSIYNGHKFYNFNTFHGLPNNFCYDIHFDQKGVAWIATDFGICSATLSEGFVLSTKNYSMEDGLKSNSIASIISDNENNIWIGHNKGVDRLNPATKEIGNYGIHEGYLPVESNYKAVAKDKNGNIWFGTIDGVVKYSPENDIKNTQPPKVYIRSIHLYNDTTNIESYFVEIDSISLLPKELRLSHKRKNVYFKYVGLHYTIVEKNTYQYRLLGYDDKWSEPTTDIQSIPYQKLSNGKYTFQVKAANCDGVWTPEPAEFTFEIRPPFWKTWWFRILVILIAIGLLYLYIYLREQKLRHDKKVLQQKVKERTIEIEKQKDQIEEQHDRIAKQKKEITDSIEYAQHIQSAILPKDVTISPLLKDYFILYKPRDIVSGDFYWIHGNNNKVIAIAADCTGHGVPGAFMSMLGVSILNEIATKDDSIEANNILNTLRAHIISTLSHSRQDEEARDGMDAALSIIDYKSYKVEFSGAYNPLILIRQGVAEVYKGNKMPVGPHMGELKDFTSITIDVQKGDCLYMYSDGYADQFGGPEGKKFKSGTFRKLLLEISTKSMAEQKEILDKTITEWMEGYEQIDDILVMGIRIV
jgi:ligand-binding sensor domain-containing protein/serine phosphatase RsbU (regulator of sigma subunit)